MPSVSAVYMYVSYVQRRRDCYGSFIKCLLIMCMQARVLFGSYFS